MSCIDVRLAVLASPDRARSLFTVRAAISSARLVLSPRSMALSLMCSYCRSRFGLDPLGMSAAFRRSASTQVTSAHSGRADYLIGRSPVAPAGEERPDLRSELLGWRHARQVDLSLGIAPFGNTLPPLQRHLGDA